MGENWPQNFLIWACGRVPWEVATTTTVFASTVDMQVVKVTPKAAWRTAQVRGPGGPMNVKGKGRQGQGGQQKVAELGMTGSGDGVWWSPMKMPQTARVRWERRAGQRADPRRELLVGPEVKGLGMR